MHAKLEVSRHRGSIDALAADWDALLDLDEPGAVFRSRAWLGPWWRHLAGNRTAHVLVAREAGRTIGILPLYERTTTFGAPARRFMGDGIVGSDYLGAIARTADQPRVTVAFARALAEEDATLHLDGIDSADPLVAALAHDARARVEHRYHCPHLRVSGDFESYLRALPEGTGAQWRRRRRWLERRPGFAIEIAHAPGEIERRVDELFSLHRARWALDGGSQAIDDPRIEGFHRDAARELAALGWARVFTLTAEGAPRAALYGFQLGRRFAFYQAGHDPSWRPRSVGTVLLGAVIEHCFQEGLAEFDFLHGSEPYKRRWARGERTTVIVRRSSAGVRGHLDDGARAIVTFGKQALAAVLPLRAQALARALRARLTTTLAKDKT
jgi:CelD/BcsL family acetyltransferase involved in cellulose biosynthesis